MEKDETVIFWNKVMKTNEHINDQFIIFSYASRSSLSVEMFVCQSTTLVDTEVSQQLFQRFPFNSCKYSFSHLDAY